MGMSIPKRVAKPKVPNEKKISFLGINSSGKVNQYPLNITENITILLFFEKC
jgi:hypothetical protein